jgi:DNA-binding HxlR family transcriptional regulator
MVKRLAKTFNCPVELALGILDGKWKSVILAYLKESDLRYGEMRAKLPKLSDKVLSERLRDLEARGLVRRKIVRAKRNYPVYQLTEFGNSLGPVLTALYAWGERAAPTLGVRVEVPRRR